MPTVHLDGRGAQVYDQIAGVYPRLVILPAWPRAVEVTVRKRLIPTALSVVLSASVLACGITPPAIRHAHHGGADTNHCHDDGAKHDSETCHHHEPDGSDHRHEEAVGTALACLGDSLAHLHWRIFGLSFCMPTPQDGEHDEDGGGTSSALVWLVDELPTLIQTGERSQGVPLAAPPAPGADRVAAESSPSHHSPPVSAIPLCDSARLERSGVLLA